MYSVSQSQVFVYIYLHGGSSYVGENEIEHAEGNGTKNDTIDSNDLVNCFSAYFVWKVDFARIC